MNLDAVKLSPFPYISGLGETHFITIVDMLLAEKYLVPVWNGVRGTTSVKIFDQLRMEMHMKSTMMSLQKLPPASSVIKEHFNYGFTVVSRSLIYLNLNKVVFNDNGWFKENDKLFATKGLKQFPTDLPAICGCKRRYRVRCMGLVEGQVCVLYCS